MTEPLILVADDESDVRELVVFRLSRSGFEVIEAADGAEALQVAKERLPALAVLDVMMPKLDGYGVTRGLREDEATQGIPVILLTSRGQEADVRLGFAVGADDYLKKPFDPDELVARVRAILGRR